ncbi:unnamed protein product [Vitrella brassicaformis CCMP3155]|uniref:SET domain-containing protein n=2 Tax=Vitrella brassicaformis TaxID=1169539 RepID=A0A0G4ETF6_VITBC|nr:unnamed protein product [Vitrella brassicaformis CCMP3155]|eukprot:CEM01889.1 unnamed protein product [Vitrella brassicaformis CCMP3155]
MTESTRTNPDDSPLSQGESNGGGLHQLCVEEPMHSTHRKRGREGSVKQTPVARPRREQKLPSRFCNDHIFSFEGYSAPKTKAKKPATEAESRRTRGKATSMEWEGPPGLEDALDMMGEFDDLLTLEPRRKTKRAAGKRVRAKPPAPASRRIKKKTPPGVIKKVNKEDGIVPGPPIHKKAAKKPAASDDALARKLDKLFAQAKEDQRKMCMALDAGSRPRRRSPSKRFTADGRERRVPTSQRFSSDTEALDRLLDDHLEADGTPRCGVKSLMSNARGAVYQACLSRGYRAPVKIVSSGDAGLCVLAGKDLEKGEYVCEYEGELVTEATAKEREQQYAQMGKGCYIFTFSLNNSRWCVDATDDSMAAAWGPGRLVNHSITPNLVGRAYLDTNQSPPKPRLCFVCRQDVDKGDELLVDYNERDPQAVKAFPWLLSS